MLLNAYLCTLLSVCVLGTKPGGSDVAPKSKAGISWPSQELTSDPVNKFFPAGSKISWSYNWNRQWDARQLKETTQGFQLKGEYVAMLWTDTDAYNFDIQEGYQNIMAFNEPDASDSKVASAVIEPDAVNAWNHFTRHFRHIKQDDKVKFVSPGVASNVTWLTGFLNDPALENKPDIIAVHAYAMDLEGIKSIIDKYRGFGKPLWITEFCMTTFGGEAPKDQQAVHDFIGQVTKFMDEDPQIERYAWFGALRSAENLHMVHPFNRLMDEQGELTALGWQYVWGGHK